MKIQYSVLSEDPNAETKFSIDPTWDLARHREYIAEECAEDYVARHGGFEGWNDGQSRAFALFGEDGDPLGVYDVTMEMEPTFGALLRKPAQRDKPGAAKDGEAG